VTNVMDSSQRNGPFLYESLHYPFVVLENRKRCGLLCSVGVNSDEKLAAFALSSYQSTRENERDRFSRFHFVRSFGLFSAEMLAEISRTFCHECTRCQVP
jgi:hypothetical protein